MTSNPYRRPGEREQDPPEKKDWSWLAPPFMFIGTIAMIIGMSVLMSRDVESEMAYRKVTSIADDVATRSRRINSCGFHDVDKGFKIVSYDSKGYERTEGFFSTRQEADEFKNNLARCKGE